MGACAPFTSVISNCLRPGFGRAIRILLDCPGESDPCGADPSRSDLRAELAYLRTFSDVYRNHLRAYLEALLRNVEEWERGPQAVGAPCIAGQPAGLPVQHVIPISGRPPCR